METEIDRRAHLKYAERRGREEGKAEGLTKVAKKMKSMGMSMDTICEATGLLAEKVAEL